MEVFRPTVVHIGRIPIGERQIVAIVTAMAIISRNENHDASQRRVPDRSPALSPSTNPPVRVSQCETQDAAITYVSVSSSLVRQAQSGVQMETTQSRLLRIQARTIAQCSALQQRCKRQLVFGLGTALRLLCIEIPAELSGDERIVVVAPRRDKRHNIAGVRCVSWSYSVRCVKVGGLTCVAPDTTWMMYARETDLRTLVLLGDALMRRDGGRRWLDWNGLHTEYLRLCEEAKSANRKLPRRIGECRLALMLVREGTDSFRESELRLLLMTHGLPIPYVNLKVEVPDGSAAVSGGELPGRRSGRCFFLDLSYPQLKVCVEYDGRQHAQSWESDVRRRTLLENAGWLCITATWEDLSNEPSRFAFAQSVAMRMSQRWNRPLPIHEPVSLEQLAHELERQTKQTERQPKGTAS